MLSISHSLPYTLTYGQILFILLLNQYLRISLQMIDFFFPECLVTVNFLVFFPKSQFNEPMCRGGGEAHVGGMNHYEVL